VPAIVPLDLAAEVSVSRVATMRRVARIIVSGTRHLLPVVVRWPFERDRERRAHLLGVALYAMVVDLGVTFTKLGQLLASSPSLAGETLANAMRGVLDDGPAVPAADVRRIVERDLGRPLERVYASFELEPFAAASLAVVHRATLLDGTDVAVKVLRPGTAAVVATDLSIVEPFVRWLARAVPVGMLPAIPDVLGGLREQLAEELDLRNEARVMAWFSEIAEMIGACNVTAPHPIPEASGQRVLTMEYVHGSTIDDLEAITAGEIDTRESIKALIEAWFALALCTGVFHGDMHAGNLRLTPDGRVVLLDWGIVGRLPEPSRWFFRRSLEGALGDESAWPDVRDHLLASIDGEALLAVGISNDDFLTLVRAQTLMIMTQPFRDLDVTMLMPTANGGPGMPGADDTPTPAPTGLRDLVRLVRQERRRLRSASYVAPQAPPRGEMLLIKQLVFFERYGKLFLADEPLIYNPEVYRTLLALPDLDAA
jgi:hypothetical protein